MCSRALVVRLLVLIGVAMGVVAQTIVQASCNPGYEWNQNSLNQDPCAVATMLDAACRSDPFYYYQKLNASEWYVPPNANHTGDLTCDCDTVMYSLAMACSTCQEGLAYGWDKWEAACDVVYISQYSSIVPQGTAIPYWAFYNVTLLPNQTFDNTIAQSLGRDPEAFPPAKSTNPTGTTNAPGKSKNETGAIVGGVVGGVAALIFIPLSAYFFYRSWRNKKPQEGPAEWDLGGYDAQWKTPPHSPSTTTYSLNTGPVTTSHHPSLPYTPSMPPPNRVITYVTPLNGNSRQVAL